MAKDWGGPDLSRARICIDFGTALSKASLCIDPTMPVEFGVKPLPIGTVSGLDQPYVTPSILFVDGGRLFFGPLALERARAGIEQGRDPLLSFKMALTADKISDAMAQKLPPTIDPTGTFRVRDALVLYLAYLDQLVRQAIAWSPSLPMDAADAKRRYTSPVWRSGGEFDQAFVSIFNEAAFVSFKLGTLFLNRDGISIAQCRDALDKAIQNPGDGRLETGVFEPHAAAAASLAFTSEPTRFILLFDMGAGTTDFSAFEYDPHADVPMLDEIKEARCGCPLAGDTLDRIIMERMMAKRGLKPGLEADIFVRTLRLSASSLKVHLFAKGECTLIVKGKATALTIDELKQDAKFNGFVNSLRAAIAKSLAVVIDRAEKARAPFVDVVLAGGGSYLPFIPDLAMAACQEKLGRVGLRVGPLSPTNALYDTVDDTMKGVFPQLAMSIGGALIEFMDQPQPEPVAQF
jgi:molecular chaperone HscA